MEMSSGAYASSAQLTGIPTIGPWFPLLSYLGAFRFLAHAQEVLQEGYDKVH